MYDKDYIVPGDTFADEKVLCLRCGIAIKGLSYKETPKINRPQEMVLVAHKIQYGNFRQVPVVLMKRGKVSLTHLPVCQDCVKEVVPERDSDQIIRQIVRAIKIEARWAGLPEEAEQAITSSFADARIVRKATADEIVNSKILEEVA